jgi:7-carboxy-7-deazaguanine synthase
MDKIIPIIQHVDKAIISSSYAPFGDKILVTSTFFTVQGEGPFAGRPAVFVRTAGCNFGNKSHFCRFCDSAFEFDKGKLYSPEALLDEVRSLSPDFKVILVITGGEPTLQHNLIKFMELAQPYFRAIQIETNGTQSSFFEKLLNSHVSHLHTVVSPKASYVASAYALPNSRVLGAARAFKFVVEADETSPHHRVPEWAFSNRKNYGYELYVSPMAVYLKSYEGEVSSIWEDGLIDKEATAKNYAYAAKYAMEHDCLLSLQTHLFAALP